VGRAPAGALRPRRHAGGLHAGHLGLCADGRGRAGAAGTDAGVPELLEALTADATLAVATSKPGPFALRILEHTGLRRFFASVHGATFDGAVRHKDQVVAAALAAHPAGREPVLAELSQG
jgi:hypothetical protein